MFCIAVSMVMLLRDFGQYVFYLYQGFSTRVPREIVIEKNKHRFLKLFAKINRYTTNITASDLPIPRIMAGSSPAQSMDTCPQFSVPFYEGRILPIGKLSHAVPQSITTTTIFFIYFFVCFKG
jgi:hypothetical protein